MSEQDAASVNLIDQVLSSKRFNVGNDQFAFADVNYATKIIKAGFSPSPLEYDVFSLSATVPERPFGDTRVQPTAYMERRPEYEEPRVAKKLNEEFGQGNWRLVELKRADDPEGKSVMLKLMLKENVAKEKFERSG